MWTTGGRGGVLAGARGRARHHMRRRQIRRRGAAAACGGGSQLLSDPRLARASSTLCQLRPMLPELTTISGDVPRTWPNSAPSRDHTRELGHNYSPNRAKPDRLRPAKAESEQAARPAYESSQASFPNTCLDQVWGGLEEPNCSHEPNARRAKPSIAIRRDDDFPSSRSLLAPSRSKRTSRWGTSQGPNPPTSRNYRGRIAV